MLTKNRNICNQYIICLTLMHAVWYMNNWSPWNFWYYFMSTLLQSYIIMLVWLVLYSSTRNAIYNYLNDLITKQQLNHIKNSLMILQKFIDIFCEWFWRCNYSMNSHFLSFATLYQTINLSFEKWSCIICWHSKYCKLFMFFGLFNNCKNGTVLTHASDARRKNTQVIHHNRINSLI